MSDKFVHHKVIYTRQKPFVKGMGLSWWHPVYGWAGDPKEDHANYEAMAITSHRDWGYNKTTPHLYYKRNDGSTLVTCGGVYPGNSCFEDGTPAGDNWCAPDGVEKVMKTFGFFRTVEEKDAMEVHALGNEQSLVAQNGNHQGNYEYAGFDPDTQREFHKKWLPQRFGTIENCNKLCNIDFNDFSSVYPLQNEKIKTEYWLFLRYSFEDFLRQIVAKVKDVNPDMIFGYAKLMGRRNPTCDDARLDFMDANCQNLYWHWYRSTPRFSIKLDELAGNAPDKPIYLTEFGLRNMFDQAGEIIAERQYKQLLPLIFMRPQVQGVYIFTYAGQNDYSHQTNNKPGDNPEFSWGMVWPDRRKRRCFYAVSECFQMFKKLDSEISDLSVQPLVAMTNQLFDELLTGSYECEAVARALYANGVPLHCLPSDDCKAIENAKEPIILTDHILYQNPDGSCDEGTALEQYLNASAENRILSMYSGEPTPMYGMKKVSLPEEKKFIQNSVNLLNPQKVWATAAPFIHGDFVNGVLCNSSLPGESVRILNAETENSADVWDVQQSLMFSKGHVYQIIVNTGDTELSGLEVLYGVSKSVNMSWNTHILFAGNDADVCETECGKLPCWMNESDIQVSLKKIKFNKLDTYVVLELGEYSES